MTQEMLSPDGRYRWDGQQWIPNEAAPPPPVPPKRRSRWPWILAITAVLLIGVCTVAANGAANKSAAGARGRTSASKSTSASTPAAAPARDGSCSPQPCANDNYGWIVSVSGFKYDAASDSQFETPEAGNVYVTLNVTFTNKLSREQHANPTAFVLLDGAGVKHTVTSLQSCSIWEPVNLTQSATVGPKCLAFEATAGKPTGLTLVWTPVFGGGDYNIKLS